MDNHPNLARTQAALDAVRNGDYGSAFEALADEVVLENGPGAGPWHRAGTKQEVGLLLMEFAAALDDTFHQDGRCIYADDRVAISLIHETGAAASGDRFDNLAVYVQRLRPDGRIDRVWTVDLDTEHCEDFWKNNPAHPTRDFS